MPGNRIDSLLQQLEQESCRRSRLHTLNLPIDQEDLIRLQALAEIYSMDMAELAPVLLHAILTDIETHLPYKPGSRVIRVEDGDPIYEDIGPMPRYLEAKRRHEKLTA